MSNANGHRWIKFYPQDWLNDHKLRLCDPASRAIWMDLLCLMSETGGYLTSFRVGSELRQIARILRTSERQIARCLEVLKQNGVASVTDDGVIYCQRMVNDFKAQEAGRDSANRRWNGHAPNGEATGDARGEPTPDPNAKKQKQNQKQKEPPKSPTADAAGDLRSRYNSKGREEEGSRSNVREMPPRFRSGAIQVAYEEGVARRAAEEAANAARDRAVREFDAFSAQRGLRYGGTG